MEITEQHIIDIDLTINTLVQQKEKLVFDKKEIENKNSVLNNQVRSGGRLHDVKYKKICDQQNKYKREILQIERVISEISIDMMKKHALRDQLKVELKKQHKVDMKQKLTEMRDYYINFAADKTRVSSMRAMGAEFAEKIEGLIKIIS